VPPRIRFGTFELDRACGELRRDGLRVRVRGRPLEILSALVERPGEVVTREELRDRLWPSDTWVDFDHGLNSAVNRLREALGDAADNPRFVETLPRRGYRFIAPVAVEIAPPEAPPAGPGTGPPAATALEPPPRRPLAVAKAAGVLVLASLVTLAGWAIWRASAGGRDPAHRVPRLAVLPFHNVGEGAGEILADGMTDALIGELSQVGSLDVISRTTAMAYKGSSQPLSAISRELDLDVAVEGSVLRDGRRARISAQLVDAHSDRGLWSRSYDCDLEDLIDLQRRVAREITESIRVTVSEDERRLLERSSPVDPEAFEAYIRGRLLRERLTPDALFESRAAFERAVELAPDYAAAWAALADVARVMGAAGYDASPPGEVAPVARSAAERALELDPAEPMAHATLGMVSFDFDWDWSAAEAHLSRALELRPSFSQAYVWYSGFLTAMGRFEESVVAARRAEELDPLSERAAQTVGFRLYYSGRLGAAEQQFRRVLETSPGSFAARLGLGLTLLESGRSQPALVELERAAGDSAGNAWALGCYGNALARAGREAEARQVLARLEEMGAQRHVSPFSEALVLVGLGDGAGAMDALERAYSERSGWMTFIAVEPPLAPLEGEPRFSALKRKVGLPPGARRATPRPDGGPELATAEPAPNRERARSAPESPGVGS